MASSFLADPLQIVKAVVAIVPAGLLFFTAYNRYDGTFRDQTVFLHFIGGLLLGALLGFLTLLLFAINAPFLQVIFPALLYPIAILSATNRRAWQGERHAIFNGGALGLGVAVMLGFSLIFVRVVEVNAATVGQALLMATGLAGTLFGIGVLAGDGVRRKSPFASAMMGAATFIAPAVFLEEFFRSGAWLWAALLAAYGLIFAIAAQHRLFPQGLSDEARRERRRRRRTPNAP